MNQCCLMVTVACLVATEASDYCDDRCVLDGIRGDAGLPDLCAAVVRHDDSFTGAVLVSRILRPMCKWKKTTNFTLVRSPKPCSPRSLDCSLIKGELAGRQRFRKHSPN